MTLEGVESVVMILILCHNSGKDDDNESNEKNGRGKKDTGFMINRDRDRGKVEGRNKGGNKGNIRESGKGDPYFVVAKQWSQ